MTDIDRMEAGPELDRLVAEKVMGMPEWLVLNEHGLLDYRGDSLVSHWSPSTNIAHAWEVVERMKLAPFHLPCMWLNDDYGYDTPEPWCCQLLVPERDPQGEATGATTPLAICRAALKAMT